MLFSQIHTLHASTVEYENLRLPSFLEGEESTPSFNKGTRNAGCRSFVSGTHSQGARELGKGGGEEISVLVGEESCWKLSVR